MQRDRLVTVGFPSASIALAIGCAAVALAVLLLAGNDQVIARRDIVVADGVVEAEDITVRCGTFGTSADDEWGSAASVVCSRPTLRLMRLAGGLAIVGGIAAVALASERWLRPTGHAANPPHQVLRRSARLGGSVLLVAGTSAVGLGVVIPLLGADEVTSTSTAEATLLGPATEDGETLAAFDVVGLGGARGGRYEEELWVVVGTTAAGGEDIDTVVGALRAAGWDLGDVTEEFSEGWVTHRGSSDDPRSPDTLEVGLASDALGDETALTANARRLLEAELPDDPQAVAVHLSPSAFAD